MTLFHAVHNLFVVHTNRPKDINRHKESVERQDPSEYIRQTNPPRALIYCPLLSFSLFVLLATTTAMSWCNGISRPKNKKKGFEKPTMSFSSNVSNTAHSKGVNPLLFAVVAVAVMLSKAICSMQPS